MLAPYLLQEIAIFYSEKLIFKVIVRSFFTTEAS